MYPRSTEVSSLIHKPELPTMPVHKSGGTSPTIQKATFGPLDASFTRWHRSSLPLTAKICKTCSKTSKKQRLLLCPIITVRVYGNSSSYVSKRTRRSVHQLLNFSNNWKSTIRTRQVESRLTILKVTSYWKQ